MLRTDILIVGAGVVGCAVARVLSRYDASVTVLEAEDDVAEGASKANSGIVHAGFDAIPNTRKAKLNVAGAEMYPALCKELGVPYGRPGALVLAFDENDRPTLEKLLAQAQANHVPDCRILAHDEVVALEPNVNPAVVAALHAPTSGLTSPYELTFALADHAAVNGVVFERGTRVTDVKQADGLWQIETTRGDYTAKVLVNCAGAWSAKLHNKISRKPLHITDRRGQYWLLDHVEPLPFTMTMFQCPTAMGKGVLVSPTVHGNMLLGPSAEDIDDPLDTATTPEGLSFVLDKCRLTWPAVSTRANITNFAGIRAHEDGGDFIIGRVEDAENAYETVGIESPGLSAAPAIGEELGGQIAQEQGLRKKASYLPPLPHAKPFYAMNDEERAQIVADAPLYGNLVCRCEVVTEAEIRAAINRPVGARSIDGVKRRTRAGMGRCQGGFCSPRVAQILAEELHEPMEKITKFGGESYLLTGTVADALKEAK